MNQRMALPPDLDIRKASFYGTGPVCNVKTGVQSGCEYVAFDYDPATEIATMHTVIALRTPTPITPNTNLSKASGIRLERVGEWILAFEPGHWKGADEVEHFVGEVQKLLAYAKTFSQNMSPISPSA